MPSMPNGAELELAQQLVRIPSLTPTTPDLLPAVVAALQTCAAAAPSATAHWLRGTDTNPATAEVFPYEVPNLLLVWGQPQPTGTVCFLGHVDVVPMANQSWTRDPFGAEVADGVLWGRGATDMKGAVAAFIIAAEAAYAQNPTQTICAIITGDEEWGSPAGTLAALQHLQTLGITPSAFLVGEPSSATHFGAGLKVGRRGSFNVALKVHGQSGHVAYPQLFTNPLEKVGPLLSALANLGFSDDNASLGVPATRATLTSVVASGGSTAIVPAAAEVKLNFRYTNAQTPEGLLALVRETVDKLGLTSCVSINANPAVGRHQNPYLSTPGQLHQRLHEALTQLVGVPPLTDAAGGLTDGRQVQKVFPHAEVVEFGPPEKSSHAGGMHQADEGLAVADLAALRQVYERVLQP